MHEYDLPIIDGPFFVAVVGVFIASVALGAAAGLAAYKLFGG